MDKEMKKFIVSGNIYSESPGGYLFPTLIRAKTPGIVGFLLRAINHKSGWKFVNFKDELLKKCKDEKPRSKFDFF